MKWSGTSAGTTGPFWTQEGALDRVKTACSWQGPACQPVRYRNQTQLSRWCPSVHRPCPSICSPSGQDWYVLPGIGDMKLAGDEIAGGNSLSACNCLTKPGISVANDRDLPAKCLFPAPAAIPHDMEYKDYVNSDFGNPSITVLDQYRYCPDLETADFKLSTAWCCWPAGRVPVAGALDCLH